MSFNDLKTAPNLKTLDDAGLTFGWYKIKEQMDGLKTQEKTFRKEITNRYFPKPREGTNRHAFEYGYEIKMQLPWSYKFIVPNNFPNVPTAEGEREPTVIDAVEAMCNELRQASNQAGFVIDRLIKWEPKIAVSEFKDLPDNLKSIVARYVESKPGSPQIEFIQPTSDGEK